MDLMDGKKLGFGCMRLPVLDAGKPDSFDHEKIAELFDAFLERGFTYFDTAYTYHGYEGEKAVMIAHWLSLKSLAYLRRSFFCIMLSLYYFSPIGTTSDTAAFLNYNKAQEHLP